MEKAGMDWIYLAQVTDGWMTLVYAVMKLRVPLDAMQFLQHERLVKTCQEGLSFMELSHLYPSD
jgi:hypothetical protein